MSGCLIPNLIVLIHMSNKVILTIY
jgi:hypothetical protein